jgi:hypothetical protein
MPGVEASVYRYAHSTAMGAFLVALLSRGLSAWLVALQRSIRDDRYLVGRRLHNLDGPPAARASPAAAPRVVF